MEQIATSIGHTFVSYARHDEAFAMTVAAAMRSRGVPIWIDQWNIEPGADWNKAIDAALNGCATFLIVLSPEAVTSDEVGAELRVALNARKRVIPLLYRPCDIPRQLLLKQHLDFTGSPQVDDASLDRLARVLREEEPLPDAAPTRDQDRSSRQTLLHDVRAEAGDRLRSIGTETPLPILLEQQPHQVAPWRADEGVVPARRRRTPPAADIVEVFDEAAAGGSLLILGKPGAGKTTVLLQLMQELAARADLDGSRPIPVLVSLASWKIDRPIAEWLVDELKAKHGVRVDLGRRWRDDRRIAPLLDGLDEMPAEHLQACVEAINEFQQAYRPSYLVVCCRQAEYENLEVKLRLRGAVCLRPLDTDQIRAYLDQTGTTDLWGAIHGDAELMEMARSPLLLSFMSALPSDPDAQRWQDGASANERRQRLFDTYVSSHSSAVATRGTYSREQTLRWLRELATTLKRQGESEFLVERMQPHWLEWPVQRWCYRAGVLIVSAVAALVAGQSLLWLFGLVPPGNVGIALEQSPFSPMMAKESVFNQTMPYLMAAVVGCLIAFRTTIVPIETLTWSWARAWKNMRGWAQTATVVALDYGMPVSVAGSLLWSLSSADVPDDTWQRAGMWAGLAGSAFAAILLALVKPSVWIRSSQRPAMRPRMIDALRAAVVYAFVIGLSLLWSAERDQILPLVSTVLLSSLVVFTILGFSGAANDRARALISRALMTGVLAGAAVGAILWLNVSSSGPSVLTFMRVWAARGLAVGLIAGIVSSLALEARDRLRSGHTGTPASLASTWRGTVVTGLTTGVALGLAAVLFARTWNEQPIRNLALFVSYVHRGFLLSTVAIPLGVIGAMSAAGVLVAFLGAGAGALSGATGADVERRLVPNQGIRQSAMNVLIFAALGTLIIGVPYGLLNLSIAALAVQTVPTPGDWLRLGVGAGIGFGVLAGFLPGAACIQHFVLRFVLWVSGTLPLRCVRFLNYATRRRLLQRVGGRYRFIHVLLRDHLSEPMHAQTLA